jgi:acyl-CoA thioesterase
LHEACIVNKIGENVYEGFVTDIWSIGDAPNGGYLMMMAINAGLETCPPNHPDPICFTATYLAKADENVPAQLHVRQLQQTRSTTTVTVTMIQAGVVRSEYTGLYGSLNTVQSMNYSHLPPISKDLPQRSDCLYGSKDWRKLFGHKLNIVAQTDVYVSPTSPAAKGICQGQIVDEASVACYLGLANQERLSLLSMAFFNDAMFPSVINLVPDAKWIPTLQYTVHFWNAPPSALLPSNTSKEIEEDRLFVMGKFDTNYIKNSWLYTDGEIWSYDGKILLATSRQMARVMSSSSTKNKGV